MKPTGFIEDKQSVNSEFKRGDWVVSGNLNPGLQSVGIVNEEMRICWLDGWISEHKIDSDEMSHIRHITAQELAMFNMKCD